MSDFSNKHNIWDIFIVHYMKIRVHYNQSFPGILWCSFNFEDFINQQFVSLHHHFLSLHHHLIILFWNSLFFEIGAQLLSIFSWLILFLESKFILKKNKNWLFDTETFIPA